MSKVQIIIVGAGPTGLMAANLLGQAGIDTHVIERHAGLSQEARAITIDDEGLRICRAVDLAEEVCKQALLNVNAYYVSQKRLLVHVAPQHQPNGYPLISTFYQPDFEAILLQGLKRFPSVNICFGQTVEAIEQNEDGVMLTVRMADDTRQSLDCTYLLACDGGRSELRQALSIALRPPRLRDLFYAPSKNFNRRLFPFSTFVQTFARWVKVCTNVENGKSLRRKEYATQRWLVVDYKDFSQPSKQIIFYCNPARPSVSVQAPNQRKRWEFMLKPGERDEDLLDEHRIANMIRQAKSTLPAEFQADESTDSQIQIERKVIYKFYATIASTFAREHVFLLGDAAHLMPPFGGQGMNSGLRDAHNLCWKLTLVIEGRASQRLLESYGQERYPHVAQMITFSSLLGKLIMPTNPVLAWTRDQLIHTANRIPFVRTQLSDMRIKPQPTYTQGFLLPAKGPDLAGRLLPQPYVMQNGIRILLDEVLGTHFALLRLYENPDEAFAGIEDEVWTRLELRLVCILPGRADKGRRKTRSIYNNKKNRIQKIVVDCDDILANFLHNRQDMFLLIRPDLYVMTAFNVRHVNDVERALWKWLQV